MGDVQLPHLRSRARGWPGQARTHGVDGQLVRSAGPGVSTLVLRVYLESIRRSRWQSKFEIPGSPVPGVELPRQWKIPGRGADTV